MDEEYINKITLEYLLNPNILINKEKDSDNLDKDIKFYRKRICQITKNMTKGEFVNNNIKEIFINYASQIIYFLKQEDIKDFFQEEYTDLSLNSKEITKDEPENIDIDKILITTPKQPVNLNNFVKKINVVASQPVVPVKKNINIKDPTLRNKGVKKE